MATNKTELPPELVQALQAIEAEASQVVEETTEDPVEALVAANGLSFTRGRTYLNEAALTAAARVLSTGTPEVVETDGGRTSHLVIFKTERGSIAVQNCYQA